MPDCVLAARPVWLCVRPMKKRIAPRLSLDCRRLLLFEACGQRECVDPFLRSIRRSSGVCGLIFNDDLKQRKGINAVHTFLSILR